MLRPLPNHMILRLPNDDDGCMNSHNAPDCYVQQLTYFNVEFNIKNRIIMFVLIILNGNYQYMYFVYVFLSNKQVPSILP